MPLMAHPDNPNTLLLAQSGKIAGSEDCCCDDGDCCESVKVCGNVVGSTAHRDAILIVAGFANDDCTRCTNANGTFLHDTGRYQDITNQLTFNRTCSVTYNGSSFTGATNTFDFCLVELNAVGWWSFGFSCFRPGGANPPQFIFGASLFTRFLSTGATFVQYGLFSDFGDSTEFDALCSGTALTLPLTLDQSGDQCIVPPSVQLQLL